MSKKNDLNLNSRANSQDSHESTKFQQVALPHSSEESKDEVLVQRRLSDAECFQSGADEDEHVAELYCSPLEQLQRRNRLKY